MQATHSAPEISSLPAKRIAGLRIQSAAILVLGIGAAMVIAFLITRGDWMVVPVLLAVVPLAALLIKYPFSGILLWLLLMPFVSVLPSSSLVYWGIYRILPPALLGLALLYRLLRTRPFPPLSLGPAELGMGLLLAYVPASILLGQNDNTTIALTRFGDRLLLPFCMYWLVRSLAPRKKELIHLQWIALFIALTQSFIGFLSWYAPHVLPEAWLTMQGARTTGSLRDPDLYAAMLAFSGVLLFHAAVNRKPGFVRWMFFLVSGVCAIFVFLSLERAAWLGGVFVIIGLTILYPKTMFRLLLIGGIAVAMLGSGFLSTHFALSATRFTDSSPVYDRLVVFDAMTQMIYLKPVLGWGYETLDQNIQPFYRMVGEASITTTILTSHNTYLTVLTELGMVGFTLYMFPVIWWCALSLKVWRRMPKRGLWSQSLLAVLWLAMLFNFTVSNFMDMRWFEIGVTLWWLTLGLIANVVYPYVKIHHVQPPILIGLK